MGSIGPTELIIVGIIIVLLFGATRLPATAKGLGQALKLFKREVASDGDQPEVAGPQAQQVPVAQSNHAQRVPVPGNRG